MSFSLRCLGGVGAGAGGDSGGDVGLSSRTTWAESGTLDGLTAYDLDRPNRSRTDRSDWCGSRWGERVVGVGIGVVLAEGMGGA